MKLLGGVIGCGLVALLLGGSLSAAPVSGRDYNPTIALRFAGTYYAKFHRGESPTTGQKNSPETDKFQWEYTWKGTWDDLYHNATRWQGAFERGTVTIKDDNGLGVGGSCTFGVKPHGYQLSANLHLKPSEGTIGPHSLVGFEQPPPVNGSGAVVVTAAHVPSPNNPNGAWTCDGVGGDLLLSTSGKYPRLWQSLYEFPLGTGGAKRFHLKLPFPGGEAWEYAELTTTFAMHNISGPAGGAPAGGAPTGGARGQGRVPAVKKEILANDLHSSITNAVYPCLVTSSGVGLLAAPTATMVGTVLLAGFGPACALWVKAIYEEARIVADPPRSDYGVVAHATPVTVGAKLPPCAKFGSAQLALCKRLEAAVAAYLKAVGKVASVSAAVRTTVERDGAAAKAGKTAAVAAQEQALAKLASQLTAAQAARREEGAALAAALRSAKVSIKLSRSKVATGLAQIKAKVASLGLPQAKFSAIAGPRLTPRPIDVLASLGS